MSDNSLLQKIKADTADAVAEINAKSEADVASVNKETEAIIASLRLAHEEDVTKAKTHLELVTTSRAKQAANIAKQRAKREEIDAVFAEIENLITTADSATYVSFFTEKVQAIVPKDSVVRTVEAPLNRAEETKQILSKVEISATVQESEQIEAGLILHTDNGVYDVSFKRIFSDRKGELEIRVAEKIK